jgi:hypothetical protein
VDIFCSSDKPLRNASEWFLTFLFIKASELLNINGFNIIVAETISASVKKKMKKIVEQ